MKISSLLSSYSTSRLIDTTKLYDL